MRSGLSELLQSIVFAAVLVSVSAQVPPIITKQPVGVSISVGATATFNVNASADPAPAYQWQRNAQNLSAATNRTFQLLNAQPADAATYRVVVSNELGSVTSADVELDVDPAFTE